MSDIIIPGMVFHHLTFVLTFQHFVGRLFFFGFAKPKDDISIYLLFVTHFVTYKPLTAEKKICGFEIEGVAYFKSFVKLASSNSARTVTKLRAKFYPIL